MSLMGMNGSGAGVAAGSSNPTLQSLRFTSANSSYLTRVFGAPTNNLKWTLSFFVKRGTLANSGVVFAASNGGDGITGAGLAAFENYSTGATDDSFTFFGVASGNYIAVPDRRFRDTAGFMHIVIRIDTADATQSNRVKLYINGVDVGGTIGAFAQNFQTAWNRSGYTACFGRQGSAIGDYFDGYLSHISFVDGQALTPSSFAQTDSTTGQWVPLSNATIRTNVGTWGNNGFFLPFNDATSTTTLGYDRKTSDTDTGGNNWTLNNFQTYDQVLDSPTNNFAVGNPLEPITGRTLTAGNISATGTTSFNYGKAGMGIPSGKFYWEVTVASGISGKGATIGIDIDGNYTNNPIGYTATSYAYREDGRKVNNSTQSSYGNTFTDLDVIGVALDMTNGKLFFSKNGTWQNSGDPAAGTNAAFTGLSGTFFPANGTIANAGGTVLKLNLGQGGQTGLTFDSASGGRFKYTPPSGYKALCTANLPTATVVKPSSAFVQRYEAGSGIAANIASDRTGWTDWIEIFKRTDSTEDWKVRFSSDTSNMLSFNLTSAKAAWSAPSTGTYMGCAIKASAANGVVTGTYTGDNTSNRNISHSLGVAPTCAIIRSEAAGHNWYFWHRNMAGATTFLTFPGNTTDSTTNTPFGTGNWSSTQFMVTNNGTNNLNVNGAVYRYILFADTSGFVATAKPTGNANIDGTFVYAGGRVALALMKNDAVGNQWSLQWSAVPGYNPTTISGNISSTTAAGDAVATDMVSNGLKHRTATAINGSAFYGVFLLDQTINAANAR